MRLHCVVCSVRLVLSALLAFSLSACAIPAGEGRSLHLGVTWVERETVASAAKAEESVVQEVPVVSRTATLGAWLGDPVAGSGVGAQMSRQIAFPKRCHLMILADEPSDIEPILDVLTAELGADVERNLCVQSQ